MLESGALERGSLAVGAAVAVNLPRLARRAGPWREDAFLSALSEAIELALGALISVAEFQGRARGLHGSPVADRVVHTLLPVGLLDALRILGDGIARADQGARILGFMGEAIQRMGAARGLDLRLSAGCLTSDAHQAASWFATCDARQGGPEQPRLFSDLPRPEEDRPSAYRAGLGELTARRDPKRIRERAEALGTLLCTVPSGALVPGLGPGLGPGSGPSPGPWGAGQGGADQSSGEPSAAAADFHEVLARAPKAVLGARSPDSSQESAAEEALLTLERNRSRWPRLAAWARFAEVRAASGTSAAAPFETTLF